MAVKSFVENVNNLAQSLYGDSDKPINVSIITNNIDSLLLVADSINNGNMEAYVTTISQLVVDIQSVESDALFEAIYNIDTNVLTMKIPKGVAGEKGDKPIVTFALDGAGNLSYEITYEHDYADGIGDY